MIGTGILKGMAVTARNFFGSYFEKERLITVQYPEERSPLPENYRNFPFLIYDTNDAEAGLRCVACKICEKECPPQCIYIIKSEDKTNAGTTESPAGGCAAFPRELNPAGKPTDGAGWTGECTKSAVQRRDAARVGDGGRSRHDFGVTRQSGRLYGSDEVKPVKE